AAGATCVECPIRGIVRNSHRPTGATRRNGIFQRIIMTDASHLHHLVLQTFVICVPVRAREITLTTLPSAVPPTMARFDSVGNQNCREAQSEKKEGHNTSHGAAPWCIRKGPASCYSNPECHQVARTR